MIYQKIYKNRLKPPKKFENWVKDFFPIYEFTSKGEVIKTSERKGDVTRRQLRSNTNFNRLSKNDFFTIIQSTSKRIELQIYKVFFEINEKTLKEEFYFALHSMMKYENGDEIGIHTTAYGEPIYKGGFRNIVQGVFQYADDGVIYPYSDKTFYKSELRHIQNVSGLISPKNWNSRLQKRLSRVYKYRLGIEAIQRLGGYRLVEDISSDKNIADMRFVTKSYVIRNRKHVSKNCNYHEIEFYEELRKQGIQEDERYASVISVYELRSLHLHPAQHSKTRLLNYLIRQGEKYDYYKDYLDMLNQLGIPAEDRIVFYPKNLTEAHDDLVRRINLLEVDEELESNTDLDEKARDLYNELSELEYTGDKYSVVAPKGLKDILMEGKELNHCAGGSRYLKGHANKDFAIMFLRNKNSVSESLITFTYHYDGRVSSIHGYGNKDDLEYLDEAKDFIKKDWLKRVTRKGKDGKEVLSKI